MAAVLAFIFSSIGRYVVIGMVALSALGGIYLKGRSDQKAADKSKIEREIRDAITKGDAARIDALRKFDAAPDSLSNDGFERP